jgi:1,4-alpha-glucan branching enzyme
MNVIDRKPDNEVHSTMHPLRPVNFYYHVSEAKSVQLAGDFNHWNPFPMKQRVDGWWFTQVMLVRGHHQYHFVVDGHPVPDPRAMGRVRNQLNEEVSIVAVG